MKYYKCYESMNIKGSKDKQVTKIYFIHKQQILQIEGFEANDPKKKKKNKQITRS